MKIIEAMKKIKSLTEKAADLRQKIGQYCADLDFETPTYPDQKGQIDSWLQAHSDVLKEILHLRTSISLTNIKTQVQIELGDKTVTKSIAEWVHRRRDLAVLEMVAWSQLGDRNLKEGMTRSSSGDTKEVKIRRYFEPKLRDEKRELFRTEPSVIDATLEVVNATTELIEA